jgi:hypothetical protein
MSKDDDDDEIRACENCDHEGLSWVEFELTGLMHDEFRLVTLCEICGGQLMSQVGLPPEEGSITHFSVDESGNIRSLGSSNGSLEKLN